MSEGRRPPATASAQTHEVPSELPVLPLRDTVLFPGGVMPLAVGRSRSVKLIETALEESQLIAFFTQRDAALEEPGEDDLYRVGTLAQVHKIFPAAGWKLSAVRGGDRSNCPRQASHH